ncbi:MAG TPA: serine/threonine-protein kinase, partial [Kofleriaceae bacterium]|nr:serine/threonine-protein kinase [Kofleriaceae bacterium]
MIGATLGSFRIVSELGTGGMGVIYRAEHQMIGKRAAIKVLRPELSRDREVVSRFFNEAKAVTAIDHPGLVDIYDFGYTPDGSAYIVMELLAGESLGARLRRERVLAVPIAVALARQLCGVLAAAHDRGIVHRDLKPDNVYLAPDPDVAFGVRAKVLDFGIAKLAPGLGELGAETRTGMLLGTPLYMAPEQCRGARDIDHRADIYALGVMLFEMVTGQVPFTGIGLGEVIAKHQYEPAPAPRAIAPELPPALDALIARMLAKPPAQRPQTMHEVAALLEGRAPTSGTVATVAPAPGPLPVTTGPLAAGTATGAIGTPAPTAPRRRRGVLYAGAAIVAAGGAVAIALALRGGPRPERELPVLERLPAETELVFQLQVTALERTPLWQSEVARLRAAMARNDDEHLFAKFRDRCDLDPLRDLRSLTYALGDGATRPNQGALVIDADWDRNKLERCLALLQPEVLTTAQPDELAGSSIRQLGDAYIAWLDPHTMAMAPNRDGLPYLRQIVDHPAPASDRSALQRATAPIDRDAVMWFAASAPDGLPDGIDPLDALDHATDASGWVS